jgi:hypothetical protein
MKITIESTDQLTDFDGAPVRVWNGVTEKGTRCYVLIRAIAVRLDQDRDELDRDLMEIPPPRPGLKILTDELGQFPLDLEDFPP